MVERALSFVTIFNGSPNVDVTIASPEVFAAQSKNPSASLNNAASGGSPSSNEPNSDAGTPNPGVSSPQSGAFRASIQVKLRDGRRLTSEVVFVLGGDGVPYRVLSWQDELTSGQRQQRRARLQ
jgi:general secretion pathway protein K